MLQFGAQFDAGGFYGWKFHAGLMVGAWLSLNKSPVLTMKLQCHGQP